MTDIVEVGGCPHCGCVLPDLKAVVDVKDEIIATLQEDNVNLERELRSKRATISRMTNDQYHRLLENSAYNDAEEVLDYWQRVLSPKAREPYSRPRLEAVIARLNGGYEKATLKQAIDGYALHPYMINGRRSAHGTPDDWKADAELIFRDGEHVDRGLRSAERAREMKRFTQGVGESNLPKTGSHHSGQLSALGQAAVRFAQLAHWYVFPCHANAKTPATRHGLSDATLDLDRIRSCWAKHPDLNVAIRTGIESGLVVLDVDDRSGGLESLHALEKAHGELPPTLRIVTPGGGTHYYFIHPGKEIRNSAGIIGEGLDVRGDGGYVLAPPSVNGNGRSYEVDERLKPTQLPAWLLTELVERQLRIDTALASQRWSIVFDGVGEGARNDRMTSVVGSLVNAYHGDVEKVTNLSAAVNEKFCRPPLSQRELDNIVKSVLRMEARR